jgi:hypothetical protein
VPTAPGVRNQHAANLQAWSAWCRLVIIAFLPALTGCLSPSSNASTPADLLSLTVHSSQARAYAGFNETVAQAMAAGETWPGDPIVVVRRFADWGGERMGVWMIEGSGERPSRYKIVAIADGFPNDSVRGERVEVLLERSPDGSWRITDARVSWRCWRGNTDSFATEACR